MYLNELLIKEYDCHIFILYSLLSIDALTLKNMGNTYSLLFQTHLFDVTIRRNVQPQLNIFKESIQSTQIDNETLEMYLRESLHFMQGNVSEVLLINIKDIDAMVSNQYEEYKM